MTTHVTMTQLKVVTAENTAEFSHLKRSSAIEQGRANALDLLVRGAPLNDILGQLISSLEQATPGLKCSILRYIPETQTLYPIVCPSLPVFVFEALKNIPVGPDEAGCGAAVSRKEVVITEDITTDQHWAQYHDITAQAGLKACWSQPIISPDGEVFGAFAMYFGEPGAPSQDDLDSLEYEAKIVAVILERARNLEQLTSSKEDLEKRVEERTKELSESNVLLKKALSQRNEVQSQLVEMENMAALGTMMSSLTHEINTPVGVGITASSHLRAILHNVIQRFQQGELKRSELSHFFNEAQESAEIIERNLLRSTELIKTFKQLSVDQHSQEARSIGLCNYLDEILLTLKPRLKRTQHKFCIDVDSGLEIMSNPGAISQLLINLIMNSVQHGFEENTVGRVFIKARVIEEVSGQRILKLTYKDNGIGMTAHTVENIYKPFFTQARNSGGSGLGMHICYDLVVKVLEGHIDCRSKLGKGVEFTITFPIQMPTTI